jgi:hypothetical protein
MQFGATHEIRDGYMFVKATGAFDSAAALDLIYKLSSEARSRKLHRVLCDLTLLTGWDSSRASLMTRFDTSEVVAHLVPMGLKLAILETPQQFVDGKRSEEVLCSRGGMVKVTSDLQDALQWLGVSGGPPVRRASGAVGRPEQFAMVEDRIRYQTEKLARQTEAKGMNAATASGYAREIVHGQMLQLSSLPLHVMKSNRMPNQSSDRTR